jgi:hypothetical protein
MIAQNQIEIIRKTNLETEASSGVSSDWFPREIVMSSSSIIKAEMRGSIRGTSGDQSLHEGWAILSSGILFGY